MRKKLLALVVLGVWAFGQNALERQIQCADAGANDTYACSAPVAPAAYVTGQHYRFMANTANTGAATINLNALGAKTIVKVTSGITTTLADNDIRAGQWVDLIFDGINMQMQSTLGNAGGGTGNAAATEDVASGATPLYTMQSNTLDTKTTAALATNITSCTIAAATTGQSITWVLTASGATRTVTCTDISGLGTLSIADGITCTINARATSATTAAIKGPISCPNGNDLTIVVGGTATVTYAAGTYNAVGTAITNTFGAAGTLDMSAATNDEAFRLPNVAGAANTTEGACSFDTTGDNVHCGENGVDTILPSVIVSTPLVDGNCVEASVASSRVRLVDAGAACGGSAPYSASFGYSTGTMTGSDVTMATFSTVPVLASGKCYRISLVFTNPGSTADWKIFADATQIAAPVSSHPTNQYINIQYMYCNDVGSQTAQHMVADRASYTTNPNGGNAWVDYYEQAINRVPTSVTWSSTHDITVKVNGASGTATLFFASVESLP